MTEEFNVEQYKELVGRYASLDSVFKNFEKANYDPNARALVGQEVFGDQTAYVLAGTDSFYKGTTSARTAVAGIFQDQTRAHLDGIVSQSVANIGENILGYVASNVPAPEGEDFSEVSALHRLIVKYQEIISKKNVGAAVEALVEAVPEHVDAIRYHAINNRDNLLGIFQRGIVSRTVAQFMSKFQTEDESPVTDMGMVSDYTTYALGKIADAEKFADAMLPLVTQTYLSGE